MKPLDCHLHTSFSNDSEEDVKKIIVTARDRGFSYLAVTDHFDPDFAYYDMPSGGNHLDIPYYTVVMHKLKEQNEDIGFAVGAELAYCPEWAEVYGRFLPAMDLDVVINSLHIVLGDDPCRDPGIFRYGVKAVIDNYLNVVYESLFVNYEWNIIPHLGYPMRYVPEGDKMMSYDLAPDLIDKILKEIVKQNKCLEYNTKLKNDPDIFARYFELGGRNVSFGSDAHQAHLIGTRFDEATELMKKIGFDGWTVYKKMQPQKILFD